MATEQGISADDSVTAAPNPVKAGGGVEAELRREPNVGLRFFKMLGPGLITGASDDDPSGIGTYAVTGAQLGYGPLWTALATFPLMASVQFICAKIGMVSGRGIAGVAFASTTLAGWSTPSSSACSSPIPSMPGPTSWPSRKGWPCSCRSRRPQWSALPRSSSLPSRCGVPTG